MRRLAILEDSGGSKAVLDLFPVCSFCGKRPVVAWFEGPHFKTSVNSPDRVRADEAWLACSGCLLLVEADDREGLAQRGANRLRQRGADPELMLVRAKRTQEEQFWRARES